MVVKTRRQQQRARSNQFRYVAAVALAAFLAIPFYFIDPREFLENLGYATLATLSLIELIRIVTRVRE